MTIITPRFYAFLFWFIPLLLPRVFYIKTPSKWSFSFIWYRVIILIYSKLILLFEQQNSTFKRQTQKERLVSLILRSTKVPFWKGAKATGDSIYEMLDTFDVISREDLIDKEKTNFLTLNEKDERIIWRRSGGSTTGTPFVWGLNKELLVISVYSRFIYEFKLRNVIIPFWTKRNYYLEFNYPHTSERSEFKHVSVGDFSTYKNKGEAVEKLINLSKGIVRTTPTELFILAQYFEQLSIKPPVSAYSVTGQVLHKEVKNYIKNTLKAKIVTHYGAQELGPLSFECTEKDGTYHVFEERVFIEILSEKGERLSEGEVGNITITVLDNYAMPLIRYQLGDLGKLTNINSICACGKNSPLLHLESRDTDFFIFEDGNKKSINHIVKSFNQVPLINNVKRFQLKQVDKSSANLTIQLNSHIAEEEVRKRLDVIIKNYYPKEFTISITFSHTLEYTGSKFKVFIPLKDL